jgi:predicted esterase
MTGRRGWIGGIAVLALGAMIPAATTAASTPAPASVQLIPSHDGWLGAWLLIGPYRSATNGLKPPPPGLDPLSTPPPGIDESTFHPSLGAPWGPPFSPKATESPRWVLASSSEGPVDVRATLHANEADIIAYAAGTLHVEHGGRLYLLLGTDDGVRVLVDGKPVWTRDEPRPERDDDDFIPLDLSAGDHPIVFKLHQREGAWLFHARLVDSQLAPPRAAYLALPGASSDDARDLAAKMSWVSVDRGAVGGSFRPRLTVRFGEGAPRGIPLDVRAKLIRGSLGSLARETSPTEHTALFDVAAGGVPVADEGVDDLVVSLPAIAPADLPRDEEWTYEVTVAGRVVRAPFVARRELREALAHAERTLAPLATSPPVWLPSDSLDSVLYLRDRLVGLVSHGDGDHEAQAAEARELDAALDLLDKQKDPYKFRTGLMRRAIRSPVDGRLDEVGLFVPPGYRSLSFARGKRRAWPLIVVLHGLNGRPMAMIRYLFGGDDPKKENDWEDRHPLDPMPPLDAFVVAPSGHGNTMYRDLGEDDVLRAVDWVMQNYVIDEDRITITGPSMGGIGSAAVPLHHPDVFAAAEPLCGYHSYFVRRDVTGRPMRPWERILAEERSNVMWAENGQRLPLWIVHGTLDLPEANSGVLIKRYEDLGFSIVHDHPELGHNVWQTTYEDMKGANWLLQFHRTAHPRSIHFRTMRLRDGDDAWLHVDELAAPDIWGDLTAKVRGRGLIDVTTAGITALHFDRDSHLVDPSRPLTVRIDGTTVPFEEGDALALHKEGAVWRSGLAQHDGPFKHGALTGPLRDAFHEPLMFVYGASDPTQTRANEEVARAWAQIRGGVTVRYPVLSDGEFLGRGEPLGNDRALFLVGNARSNAVVRALEPELPLRIEGDGITLGSQLFTGEQLGAAFIRPNPKRTDRYVVIVEGVNALGTWRSLSLPELLPDFVVYDVSVAPARGQILLGAGMARAAGFFRNDWSLPPSVEDPLAKSVRPKPKTEYEATPYLP